MMRSHGCGGPGSDLEQYTGLGHGSLHRDANHRQSSSAPCVGARTRHWMRYQAGACVQTLAWLHVDGLAPGVWDGLRLEGRSRCGERHRA